ncbi:protein of unknown function [Candidatus Nitrosocosmicus franklandus]|uniref:Uncharacterized protein n=1 Tax=Candidatus Nitrosocosmicus franklandianus TaxID=1798806 RepID=A0A484I8G1_9ARCH|nr:protein of unknown function [Candidatus Nitrosocosmicus franklandus]
MFQIYEDAEKDELELCCREENISLSKNMILLNCNVTA